jgi:hypothetical protein
LSALPPQPHFPLTCLYSRNFRRIFRHADCTGKNIAVFFVMLAAPAKISPYFCQPCQDNEKYRRIFASPARVDENVATFLLTTARVDENVATFFPIQPGQVISGQCLDLG